MSNFDISEIYAKLKERGICTSKGVFEREFLLRRTGYLSHVKIKGFRLSIAALGTLHVMLIRRGIHDLAARVYEGMVNEVLRRQPDDAG